MEEHSEPQRTGRRPGNPDTRGEILQAARRVFERDGYQASSVRGIAREAGVDPALIHRWFGDKRALFVATLRTGFDPADLLAQFVGETPEGIGARLAMVEFSFWESAEHAEWVEHLTSNPALLPVVVGYMEEPIIRAAQHLLGVSTAEAKLRASVVLSLLLGFVATRYVIRFEPLASLSRSDAARIVGPMLQHAFTGDLGIESARRAKRRPRNAG